MKTEREKQTRFHETKLRVTDVNFFGEHDAIAYYEIIDDEILYLTIQDLEDDSYSDMHLSDNYIRDKINIEELDINHDLMMNFNPARIEIIEEKDEDED